jgi:hypothetical protein
MILRISQRVAPPELGGGAEEIFVVTIPTVKGRGFFHAVAREVVERQNPATGAAGGDNRTFDRPAIERIGAARSNQLECPGEFWLAQHLPGRIACIDEL